MAEITYLLGAGASYGALPVVSEMYNKIGDTISWFRDSYQEEFKVHDSIGRIIDQAKYEKMLRIIIDLQWLRDICHTEKNFSVDTYARKLSLSEDNEKYIKLKNVLSFFFTIEQKRKYPDVRYDNFWASILKSRTSFPNNIKIISWNYDFQLELTYQDFLGFNSLKAAREAMNISSQETDIIDLPDSGQFGIFKLNGSATFNSNDIRDSGVKYLIDDFKTDNTKDFLLKLVESYENLCNKPRIYRNHLSFAWEHRENNPFYKHLQESVCNTEILVVIGYSFPFFNRDRDKLILNEFMKDKLSKVYFQAPEKDVKDIRERFLAINNRIDPNRLLLRTDVQQFTLPNEL